MKEELSNILKIDKTDWYSISNGKLVWDEKKVSEFWNYFRKTLEEKDNYNFKDICFPSFEYLDIDKEKKINIDTLFWKKNEEPRVDRSVFFYNCRFMDDASFSKISFHKDISFYNCQFEKNIDLSYSILYENFTFQTNLIKGETKFNNISFYGNCLLSFNKFHGETTFQSSEFEKNTLIEHSDFFKAVNFSNSKLYSKFTCKYLNFEEKVDFFKTLFNVAIIYEIIFKKSVRFTRISVVYYFTFQNIIFKDKSLIFDEFYFLDESIVSLDDYKLMTFVIKLAENRLKFHQIFNLREGKEEKFNIEKCVEETLNNDSINEYLQPLKRYNFSKLMELIIGIQKNSIFKNNPLLYLHNIIFPENSRFRKTDFSRTSFYESDISSVSFIKCTFIQNNNRIILHDESSETIEFSELENLYRQLKQAFEKDKYWDQMDKSYVSEMRMREKQLTKPNDKILLFMYKFYGNVAGYTQDFIRPFRWYAFSTLVFFPIAYYINYIFVNNYFSFKEISKLEWSIPYYLQLSFGASLPLISSELPYDNWWLKSFQIIFSTLLITFFVLAIRRKFKF
jgi:hypothetical protein